MNKMMRRRGQKRCESVMLHRDERGERTGGRRTCTPSPPLHARSALRVPWVVRARDRPAPEGPERGARKALHAVQTVCARGHPATQRRAEERGGAPVRAPVRSGPPHGAAGADRASRIPLAARACVRPRWLPRPAGGWGGGGGASCRRATSARLPTACQEQVRVSRAERPRVRPAPSECAGSLGAGQLAARAASLPRPCVRCERSALCWPHAHVPAAPQVSDYYYAD